MELGLYTFGDLVADPHTGRTVSAQERLRQMLELARLADQAGLDLLGVGEHHSLKFVNSATATILSAMAAVTTRRRQGGCLHALARASARASSRVATSRRSRPAETAV